MRITTRVDATPPQVRIEATAMPAAAVAVRVTRSWAGSETPCPDAGLVPVVGGTWGWTDYGLPATVDGVACTYVVQALSAAGSVVDTGTARATTAMVEHSAGWLSDPLDPLSAVPVTITHETSPPGWAHGGATVAPMGGVAVSLGSRRARTRDWGVSVSSGEAWSAIWEMLERGGVLLLRADPSCVDHPTGHIHMHVDGAEVSTALPHDQWRGVTLATVEVAPPLHAVAVAAVTYADTTATYTSYARTRAALPTYADRSRGSR